MRAPGISGEAKYVCYGWPTQAGFIPANSFIMQVADPLGVRTVSVSAARRHDRRPRMARRLRRVQVRGAVDLPRSIALQCPPTTLAPRVLVATPHLTVGFRWLVRKASKSDSTMLGAHGDCPDVVRRTRA